MDWTISVQMVGAGVAALGGIAAAVFAGYARTRVEKMQRSLELSTQVCQERIGDYKDLWRLLGKVSSSQFHKNNRSVNRSVLSGMLEELEEWCCDKGYHLDPYTRDRLLCFRHACRMALKVDARGNDDVIEWNPRGREIWELKTQLRMCIARSLSSPQIGRHQGFRRCPFSPRQLRRWLKQDWRRIDGEMEDRDNETGSTG